MNLLILSGNHHLNKPWAEEFVDLLRDEFDEIVVQNYKHWQDESPMIDLNHELKIAEETVSHWESYSILAKSAGTVLTAKGFAEGRLHPEFCFFVGVPINMANESGVGIEGYAQINVPVLFVQESNDKFCPYSELDKALDSVEGPADFELVEVAGDQHIYPDTSGIANMIVEFMKDNE